jgi:4-amino-4-deoxy-L-arabinose transferase-like glycosyltransferase
VNLQDVIPASPAGAYADSRRRSFSLGAQLALLLAIHVLVWTWVGVSSRSNFDTPGDMVEAYAWSQGWQWGYYKHPPLSAWVAGLWFAAVPESNFGYSLLAALNCAVGLGGLAVLAREFLPRNWVLLTVAVASLAPGITTVAMRFNANAILVSSWPWALALFVRMMRHGRARDAVLCGVACALAMLGKYYSGVLLLSMCITALWLPAWRARLWSAPFALAVVSFAVCVAPHAAWLLAQTEGPLQYAQAATGHETHGEAVMRAATFFLAQCIFPLLAFLALRLAIGGPAGHRGFFRAAAAPLLPRNDEIWLLAMLPVLATMVITVATGARTSSVWGLAIAAGLALLATTRAREAGATLDLRRLWQTLGVIWLSIAALSPIYWVSRAELRVPSAVEPREELAQALASTWRAEFGQAVPWVSGTRALAASAAFYANGHPRYWSLWNSAVETPWADMNAVKTQGGVIVCDTADTACQTLAESWTLDRRAITVAKSEHGYHFDAVEYVVYLVAPRTLVDPR